MIPSNHINILFANFGYDFLPRDMMQKSSPTNNIYVKLKDRRKEDYISYGDVKIIDNNLKCPCNKNLNPFINSLNEEIYPKFNELFKNYQVIAGTELCKQNLNQFYDRAPFYQEYQEGQ